LRGFRAIEKSPSVAVFTTFYPDHLSYYRNSLSDYFADKQVIYAYQKPGDTLIVGPQVCSLIRAASPLAAARAHVADNSLVGEWPRLLVGKHNVDNIACAVTAAHTLGVPDEVSKAVVADFAPVAGRLQKIYDKNGIAIYNDAAAIIPEATIAAIRALAPSPLILIIGGGEKGTSLDALVETIQSTTRRIILLAGTGTERMRVHFPDVPVYQSLAEAVDAAYALATAGDSILFSPGLSSRGMFPDAHTRSETFATLVRNL
ncbi:MAG: cyanophycin synthetase, partial [Patescibacteria group bacterium]